MGLFGGTKTYVASVVYNLAGDWADQTNFVKNVTVRSAIGKRTHRQSIPDRLTAAHLSGPSIQQQRGFRWARRNYDIGIPSVEIVGSLSPDLATIPPEVPVAEGNTAEVGSVSTGIGDPRYWAEQYLFENDPSKLETNWSVSLFGSLLTITFEDLTTAVFPISNYEPTARYVYVYYEEVTSAGTRTAKLYIYKVGSGNHVLDSLTSSEVIAEEFYPYIPARIDNKSIRDAEHSDLYPQCRKAFRQMTSGGSFDAFVDAVEANPDLDDIDFSYVVFGVPLNTKDNSSRLYLFEFFAQLMPRQLWEKEDYINWLSQPEERVDPTVTTLRIHSKLSGIKGFDMNINWVNIHEEVGSGLGKSGAQAGDLWFEELPDDIYKSSYRKDGEVHYHEHKVPVVKFWFQTTESSWRCLLIRGLVHTNLVYETFSVKITANEALQDADASGFLVPMHYETVRKLSVKHSTQVASLNTFVVFNAYKVVKLKWYQSGFFQIFFAIVLAVITAFIFPGGVGILGSHLSVGTSLGLTGGLAIAAGAAVNALAAMVLTTTIQEAAALILGEEFGAVVGTVLGFLAGTYLTALNTGTLAALDWGMMLQGDNLLRLTSVVSESFTKWAVARIGNIHEEMDSLYEDFLDEENTIQKKTLELLGYGGGELDPLQLIQSQDLPTHSLESRDTFISRTLMTGSEIADLSFVMIEAFPEVTLDLPKFPK